MVPKLHKPLSLSELFTKVALTKPTPDGTRQIFAMALNADELASTRESDVLAAAKYVRDGVLIVALLRPPPTPGMPRVAPSFPQKALMNLVTDLCESRCVENNSVADICCPRSILLVVWLLCSSHESAKASAFFQR